MRCIRHVLSVAAIGALLAVAGCQSAASEQQALVVRDPYVKAMPRGEMTAVFGTVENPGAADITVESATTDVADRVELHEMIMEEGAMVMRERAGGFVVPARGALDLEPGGLHVMLIGLRQDIDPGADIAVQLHLTDGTTVPFQATAREMANAQESYDPEASDHVGRKDHGTAQDHGDERADHDSTGALQAPRQVR